MIFKTLIAATALLVTGAGLTAHVKTAPQTDAQHRFEKTQSHDHHAGYVKPGAAIAMTHDYDGETAPGKFETITITLSHMYDGGQLSLEILPTPELQIFSNLLPQPAQLSHGSTLDLPIQITGAKNGIYSVAIEAVYESSEGQQSRRVLSIPVTIGAKPIGKTQPNTPNRTKSNTIGYIALPATETIQ